MKLVAANAMAGLCAIGAGTMAYTGHEGFGVAMLVLAFLTAHSVKGSSE